VIDLLGKAYEGSLLPPDDPDAVAVHRLGREIASRFTDELLREAIKPG
jgi:hypothetical protein